MAKAKRTVEIENIGPIKRVVIEVPEDGGHQTEFYTRDDHGAAAP